MFNTKKYAFDADCRLGVPTFDMLSFDIRHSCNIEPCALYRLPFAALGPPRLLIQGFWNCGWLQTAPCFDPCQPRIFGILPCKFFVYAPVAFPSWNLCTSINLNCTLSWTFRKRACHPSNRFSSTHPWPQTLCWSNHAFICVPCL